MSKLRPTEEKMLALLTNGPMTPGAIDAALAGEASKATLRRARVALFDAKLIEWDGRSRSASIRLTSVERFVSGSERFVSGSTAQIERFVSGSRAANVDDNGVSLENNKESSSSRLLDGEDEALKLSGSRERFAKRGETNLLSRLIDEAVRSGVPVRLTLEINGRGVTVARETSSTPAVQAGDDIEAAVNEEMQQAAENAAKKGDRPPGEALRAIKRREIACDPERLKRALAAAAARVQREKNEAETRRMADVAKENNARMAQEAEREAERVRAEIRAQVLGGGRM